MSSMNDAQMIAAQKEHIAQLTQRDARQKAALREAREVLGMTETEPWYPKSAPEFAPVHELCERHGYGAVISCASSQWMEKVKGTQIEGSAHTAGACSGTVKRTLNIIDEALRG